MADPFSALGASAAIQQFLVAAGKIIQYCYGYVQKYRHAAAKVAQLAQELRALTAIFTEVKGLMGRSHEPLKSLDHLGPLILAARVDAQHILDRLPQTKMGRMQRLIWPFNEDKTSELVDSVSKRLTTVHAAIGYENLRISESTLVKAEALQKRIAAWELQQDEHDQSELRLKVLGWISFNHIWSLRFRDRHEDKRSLRHPTTGISLLTNKMYRRWKTKSFDGEASWLWVIGEAGTRKSMVMSVAVDDVMTDTVGTGVAVAILYCRYESNERASQQTLAHILGNLLSQILRISRELPVPLVAAHNELVSQGEPTAILLKQVFILTVQSLKRAYIIIDGLDELHAQIRSDLLELLEQLDTKRVKILVSSRPHSFELRSRLTSTNVITVVPKRAEIMSFLSDEIANNDKLQVKIGGDSDAAQVLADGIADKAGASFTFAVAMLGTIQGGISKAQILRLVETASTPDDVYQRTMERILQQNEKDDALMILGWLTYSKMPLTIEQLQTAMAVSTDGGVDEDMIPAEEIILEICAGLIQIQPSSRSVLLTHLTARDFLIKHPDLKPETFEPRLAQTCIRYLMSNPFETLCETQEQIAQRDTENCFATYAASYWALHAKQGREDGLEELILSFALQPFASSALQQLPFGVGESFAGPASPVEYRLTMCQDLVPASYICALFRLSKSQALLAAREPELVGTGVFWGHQYSPLHLSVWLEDLETAKILVQNSSNCTAQDRFGLNPIQLAASLCIRSDETTYKILRTMIDADVQHHARDVRDQDGETALHLAVSAGSARAITLLLERGYSPHAQDRNGSTPFHLFFESKLFGKPSHDNLKTLKIMLDHGADPSCMNSEHKSPLALAIGSGWEDTIDVLREARNPETNLPYVFDSVDVQLSEPLYQRILDTRATQEIRSKQQEFAIARQRQLSGSLEKLLRKNLHSPTTQHLTTKVNQMPFSAMSYAARKGSADTILCLLAGEGDLNATDERGWTPLHFAAEMCRENATWVLLCSGANPHCKDNENRKPIDLLQNRGSAEREWQKVRGALERSMDLWTRSESMFPTSDQQQQQQQQQRDWVTSELRDEAATHDELSRVVRDQRYHVASEGATMQKIVDEFEKHGLKD